jgi:hypothetical protein
MKNLILISDRLVEFGFFVLLCWPVWGLNPGLFGLKVHNGDQCTKRPTDLSKKIHNLGDVTFIGQCLKYSEGNYKTKKTKLRGS